VLHTPRLPEEAFFIFMKHLSGYIRVTVVPFGFAGFPQQ
jgi:hypothetical protein